MSSSFYGGLNIAALDKEYLASFYMPIFVIEQINGENILTIKNYNKELVSMLQSNSNGILSLETPALDD